MAKSPPIDPPNSLAAKVPKRDNVDQESLLAHAEAEVAKLTDSYTNWVQEDLDQLSEVLDAAQTDVKHKDRHLKALHTMAHDIKGQGGTFGYTLVTEIAGSLGSFVEKMEDAGAHEFEVIAAHVDALKVVVRQEVQGDGGDVGRQIVAGLESAVSKALK